MRLQNLGYLAPGVPPADISSSVRAFQAAAGLPVTGVLDENTLAALAKAAGA